MTQPVEHPSALPDALLRQLMAVGQVDVLVGLPTLNNAATVAPIVRAVHLCFTRDFPRLRTVMINSDGGSTDGTTDVIRDATFSEADMVQTSHSLRTLHRVVAPYHGLPGKHTALRTVFAAAELTQARALVVLDPGGPATTPERVTELITPITHADVEFLAPRYRRHPRDGLLVTQLARPLVRALYGVALDEPLGAEFSCSGRFVSHCLDRDIWEQEVARFAIDLWLRAEAVADGFPVGQIWRPATAASGTRAKLREAVQQVTLALVESLREHAPFWLATQGVADLRTWGDDPGTAPEPPSWDYEALAEQSRQDIREIRPLLDGSPRCRASRPPCRRGFDARRSPRRRALGQGGVCVCRGDAPRHGRGRASGWRVRSALPVACGGVHDANVARSRRRRADFGSTRCARHSNG